MTATVTANPAPHSSPLRKGMNLTWQQIKDCPKGTYLAYDYEDPKLLIVIAQDWDNGLISLNAHIADTSDAHGVHDLTVFRMHFLISFDSYSCLRLATKAEIKKAKRAHLKAWREALEAEEIRLADARLQLLLAERAAGLHVPLPK